MREIADMRQSQWNLPLFTIELIDLDEFASRLTANSSFSCRKNKMPADRRNALRTSRKSLTGRGLIAAFIAVSAMAAFGVHAHWPDQLTLVLQVATGLILAMALGYCCMAMLALIGFQRDRRRPRARTDEAPPPPITILKPVCGDEHALRENLRTYCVQDYAEFQIIFGVRSRRDPSVAIVQTLLDEFPQLDLKLVIDPRIHGTNYKISNLANMLQHAKHDVVISSDSDVRVGPDFLQVLASEFDDADVGAVTCLYTGSPAPGFASRLGAAFLNDAFVPSAMVQAQFAGLKGCFGQAMAFRREALIAVGGFDSVASQLADDFVLGNRILAAGYKVRLSHYLVDNVVSENCVRSLFFHELRWGRTIFAIEPLGYFFSFTTNTIAVSILCACMLWVTGLPIALAAALGAGALAVRVVLHCVIRAVLAPAQPTPFILIPIRELLNLVVWASSLTGRRVQWRGRALVLMDDGNLRVSPRVGA